MNEFLLSKRQSNYYVANIEFKIFLVIFNLCLSFQALNAKKSIIRPEEYPLARRDMTVFDDFNGTKVSDPYRWLEDPESEETKDFVKKLNALSEPFISTSSAREKIRAKLTKLLNYERYVGISHYGDFYYYYYNSGLDNQSVLYQQKSLNEKGTIFLDPNTLSADGTTAIQSASWTEDGSIFAYGLSEKGSDWVTLRFRTNSGEDLPDILRCVKHSNINWMPNNEGVFYSQYPEQKTACEGSNVAKHEFHSLYYHKLGTPQEEDVLVADFREDPDNMVQGYVTEDGQFLIVDVSRGTDPVNKVYIYDLSSVRTDVGIGERLEMKPLFDKLDARYSVVDSDAETRTLLVMTNHDAPMFKLVRVKLAADDDQPIANQNDLWETVIAEDSLKKLEWVSVVDEDKLIVCYMEDVKNTVYVHDLHSGRMLYQLPFGIGSIVPVHARKYSSEMFLTFESYLSPTVTYRADFATIATRREKPVELQEIRRVKVDGLETGRFAMKQVFYECKDGTKIPMYILHNKDLKLNGENPVVLYGYGGFNIADMPNFSVSRLLLLQHFNCVVAVANLRGGSEYGEKWHEAGMREKKQNVFDDFIAAAEYLIHKQYTRPEKLAIQGGSNGGLLVAACCQQRPDLFGAVVNRVGVLDMLRFHKFTVGAAWIPEFGDPDKTEDFSFIYKYSPLHNIQLKQGQQWPATLLLTADHDDRVVPLHSLKYIAELYHYLRTTDARKWQKNPVLARIEVKAGHGSGKPMSKIIAELVDIFSFLQRVLGMKWHD